MRFVVSWSCILQQFSSTSTNGNICNINLCRSKIFQEIICYIWYLVGKCCKYWNDELFWWIVFVVWLTNERRLVLFPAGTIVRDPHHRESPTRRAGFEPAQNLSSGLVEWSCAVVITTTPRRLKVLKYEPWMTRDKKSATILVEFYSVTKNNSSGIRDHLQILTEI